MRLIKVTNYDPHKQTMPKLDIATILTDVRCLCSNYENYTTKSIIGYNIYNQLKKHDKTYLFNVTNFDPDLWDQVRQAMKTRALHPAYLVYNHNERLESEQFVYLSKHIPMYPENQEQYMKNLISTLVKKKGDENEKFRWE